LPAQGCVSGEALRCDDGIGCTEDACDAATGCTHVASDAACDDGLDCTAERCDLRLGCVVEADDAVCADEDACTTERCDEAVGCVSEATACRDGVSCTRDRCDPVLGCQFEADDASCDDGDACTAEVCDPELGCRRTRVICDDGIGCTVDRCDAAMGCVHEAVDAVCDDHNACNGRERCSLDADCQAAAAPLSCDDGIACTLDSCDPREGCRHVARSEACQDGVACTLDRCDAARGCVATLDHASCDDHSVCTPVDQCVPGLGCDHPGALRCDDGDRCTLDSCDPTRGCQTAPRVCDDGDACTFDRCDSQQGCQAEVVPRLSCRPVFDVVTPARGATVQSDSPEVLIVGSVVSEDAAIVGLRINGAEVVVGAAGGFQHVTRATVGGNVLVMEATDGRGGVYRRVQTFVWSPRFRRPDLAVPGSGMSDPGLGYYLAQETLDDGDHSLPMDDIGTLVDQLLSDFNIAALLPYDIISVSGFSITNRGVTTGPPTTTLQALSTGIRTRVVFPNVNITLYADGGRFLGTSWGSATASDVTIEGDIVLEVVDGALEPVLNEGTVTVAIHNLGVGFNSGTVNNLAGQVANALISVWTGAIRSAFLVVYQNEVKPAIRTALAGLARSVAIAVPNPGASGEEVDVELITRFSGVQHLDGGVALRLSAGAYSQRQTPYTNDGVAERAGCGAGAHDLRLPQQAPIELSFADDALNQILYAVWNGGFLEFEAPADLIAGLDLPAIADGLQLTISGLLPPVLSDCGDGAALLTLGDLRVEVTLTLFGRTLSLVTHTAFTARVRSQLVGGVARFDFSEVVAVTTEAMARQEVALGLEPWLATVIEEEVVPRIVNDLGGIEVDVPALDLGSGATIEIQDTTLWRDQGNTLLFGNPAGVTQ